MSINKQYRKFIAAFTEGWDDAENGRADLQQFDSQTERIAYEQGYFHALMALREQSLRQLGET